VVDVAGVAPEGGGQQGQVHVAELRLLQDRSEVLGQAGPAEAEPGVQVGAREVQAVVPAEQVHHRPRVDLQLPAEAADLVGEDDLDCVEGVARVLDRLRGPEVDHVGRAVGEREQLPGGGRRPGVMAPDHGIRGVAEVGYAAALAQEVRAYGDADPCSEVRGLGV
jgi:hypothetical protein